jgi:GMP synthase (glutamine-hydrolysing)
MHSPGRVAGQWGPLTGPRAKTLDEEDPSMNTSAFVKEQVAELRRTVGRGIAINALSGGVDSSVCTVLGHLALGRRLKTYFIDNSLMREGEPRRVVALFRRMGIPVVLVNARAEFLRALKGVTDPEKKRQAITDAFYSKVFVRLVKRSKAKFLMHGTILTDIEETVAGIKRQHNILVQLGINTKDRYGYTVVEPLKTLRKDGVRKVARALGCPKSITERIPFPGPALAARITGAVTKEKLDLVRKATEIVESELGRGRSFQYFAVLLEDKATGIRHNRREFGHIIVVRSIESVDARKATATRIPWARLERICRRIVGLPNVNRCLYDLTPKPPATIEYV